MRLEMGHIYIKDIQFADESKIQDGVLYVAKEELEKTALEDEKIKGVSFDIARPGESVRITPVKDVIEPRVKVEGRGGVFPGVISKVDTVGSGKTYALKGMAVVTAGRIVGFQEGIIDMTGPGAQYTPFSQTLNLVMVCEPVDDIKQHDYEKAVRFAGFRVAAYIGELARSLTPDETKVYETCTIKEGLEKYPELPRVAYVQMLQSQGLLHDTYVYGVDAKKIVPTILSPTEIMDGAIVSGNCVSACDKNPTYVHQNNPVVHDLFEEHGKTLNFVCQIITNENVYLADKQRSSDWTAKLCKMLDLDGVIVSQEGFGNPDTDLIMNCKKIEAEGVKTVIITDEYAGRDGKSQSLADADAAADAVVTGGNANEVIILPKLDKVIGTLDYVTKIAGASEETLREDGSLEVELQVITGATNETGFGCAQLVSSVDDGNFSGKFSQVHGLLHCGVASSYDKHFQILKEVGIAGSAVGYAFSSELSLALASDGACVSAGGNDHIFCLVLIFRTLQDLDLAAEIHCIDGVGNTLCAELLHLLCHSCDQGRS